MPNALKGMQQNNWSIADWYQCGFRPGRSTTNQIFTLQSWRILGICQRYLHMFCRPRESIPPESSWKALDGRRNKDVGTRIGKARALLHELYRSAVTKRELSNTPKLSVFKSVFVPILTYGHESWVMTERIQSQVQSAEMGFLRRQSAQLWNS